MEKITIDILPGDTIPVCHASKCDVGRVIQINLIEDSIPLVLGNDKTLIIEMKKSDTTIVTAPAVYNIGDSSITFVTTEQMCSCPGRNFCEIRFSKKDYSVGSLNFILEIEDDPGKEVESVSEIYDLEQRILDAIRKWRS